MQNPVGEIHERPVRVGDVLNDAWRHVANLVTHLLVLSFSFDIITMPRLPALCGANDLHGAVDHSGLNHAELLGRGTAHVNNASLLERASVVNAHIDAFAVGGVGNPDHGAERECPVRARHLSLVILLAAGGGPAVELVSIIRGLPLFDLAGRLFR